GENGLRKVDSPRRAACERCIANATDDADYGVPRSAGELLEAFVQRSAPRRIVEGASGGLDADDRLVGVLAVQPVEEPTGNERNTHRVEVAAGDGDISRERTDLRRRRRVPSDVDGILIHSLVRERQAGREADAA